MPYTLPPGTPKDKVIILQDAMRKAFKDANFHTSTKLTGEEPDPLMPEETDVIKLLKKLSEKGPLPVR